MTEWTFRLTLAGVALTDEELDALFEAGCDDATFSLERDGTVLGFFDRQAETQEDAVLSAIHNVESADIGARVLRVTQDDDWITASEVAARVGRTRQSIGLLIRGDRGPGEFPAAVVRHGSRNPLWSWAEVEEWFERYEPTAVQKRESKLSLDFLAELNDRLDLRERLLHTPDAPWRPKLAEALPLGA
jgi:predicted DNA-binding transcriptional regulator AlpA